MDFGQFFPHKSGFKVVCILWCGDVALILKLLKNFLALDSSGRLFLPLALSADLAFKSLFHHRVAARQLDVEEVADVPLHVGLGGQLEAEQVRVEKAKVGHPPGGNPQPLFEVAGGQMV